MPLQCLYLHCRQLFQFFHKREGLVQAVPVGHKPVVFQPDSRVGAGGFCHCLGKLGAAGGQGGHKGETGAVGRCFIEGQIQAPFRWNEKPQGQKARRVRVENSAGFRAGRIYSQMHACF